METNVALDSELLEDNGKIEIELIDFPKFVLLYFLSFGLYGVWWMYTSWRLFKEKESLDIMPAARAIFSIFFLYSLFEKIQNFAKSNGWLKSYSSGALFAGFVIVSILSRLPDPFWLVALMAFIFFIQPVTAFNFAIENSSRYKAKNTGGLTGGQIAIAIIGGILWIVILLGLFYNPEEY